MKPYQVTKEFNGTKFTAQYNGLSAALDAQDTTKIPGTGVTSSRKLSEYILENVIVEPAGLTPDSDVFDGDMEMLTAVVLWGAKVLNGSFRPASAGAKAAAKSK